MAKKSSLQETNAEKRALQDELEKKKAEEMAFKNEQQDNADIIEPPKKAPENVQRGMVLKCSCGADLLPDADGLYPELCPECHTVNDYRGVKFLEDSPDILVCGYCGRLTKIKDKDNVVCSHCGAR